jgi:hypothetical protein
MNDAVISNDGVFNSAALPVSTSGAWQNVTRLQNRGRRVLASVIVGSQSIGGFQILQAAYPDDPNPLVVAGGTGLNSPALSDESYIIPPLTFPIAANTVFQVHLQGDASELIFQAQSAGGAGATIQIAGTCLGDRAGQA